MRHYLMPLLLFIFFTLVVTAQSKEGSADRNNDGEEQLKAPKTRVKVYYGQASFYADKFNGRQTANGEIYSHAKKTAACNVLPLGTWIKVTNLMNNKSVIVKVNDRLHPKMKRIVDLSKSSAELLGYTKRGLTQVKVEVIGIKKPKDGV